MSVAAEEIATGTMRGGIADRLWAAARVEFSQRGYHGARVQGIARRAGCNVALLYRHWSSKKSLYLDVLRSVWESPWGALAGLAGAGGAPGVAGACIDVMLSDPAGAQILVREMLDGAPFLSQLMIIDPRFAIPMAAATAALTESQSAPLRPEIDPGVAMLAICGLSALIAAAHDSARVFFPQSPPPETWREGLVELLLRGLLPPEPSPPTTQ